VVGKPSKIQPGKHDTGWAAVAVVEPHRKMDHSLAGCRIGPVVTDRKPISRHGTCEERLIGD
jgi:hypothetical protein